MNVFRSRDKKVKRAAWAGILVNLLLAVSKGIIAVVSNSKALLADAVHSASDVVSSVIVLIGVKTASIPPDRDHPYGHGKAESIAAIVVAVILFAAGIQIAINSLKGLATVETAPGLPALLMAAASIVIKEGLFRYKLNVGKKERSHALVIDAWHHRSDALSSAAAVVGIGFAIFGEWAGITWLLSADGVVGILIALLIMRMAWRHGREAIHTTMDHVLHPEDTIELRKHAANVDGVVEVLDLFAREHGYYVTVDIRISVHMHLTVSEGYHIGENVKTALMQDERVKDVFVHLKPAEG